MLPYVASIGAILAGTFTLFTYITTAMLSAFVGAERGPHFMATMGMTVAPLVVASLAAPMLLEHPSQLLLYYRLWEQKIVVDFKQRGMSDQSTAVKIVGLGLILGGYTIYCWDSDYINDKWSFVVVVAQALGTVASTIYRNVSLEARLQGFNPAFRHYRAGKDQEKDDIDPLRYREKARKAVEQVQFVAEKHVRYDIVALRCYCEKVLKPKLKKAKAEHDRTPTPATAATVAACNEEAQWLKVLGMWIGRLGNDRATVRSRWGASRVRNTVWTYAKGFLTNGYLYDDALWHAAGSFKQRPNRTGSTRVLFWGELLTGAAIVVIEIYGLLR